MDRSLSDWLARASAFVESEPSITFCAVLFLLSYRLLFWSDRSLSFGVSVVTVMCAASAASLVARLPATKVVEEGGALVHTLRTLAKEVWR